MAILIATLAAAGCGTDFADPTGSVAGEVTDGITGLPMANVSASLWTGDNVLETDTDAEGRFTIEGVPAGSSLPLDLAIGGYALERRYVGVDDSAGEEPQDNSVTVVDAKMFRNVSQIRVRAVDGFGAPVSGVDLLATGGGDGFELPERLTATTGGNGEATIPGVAIFQSYEIRAMPFSIQGNIVTGEMTVTHRSDSEVVELTLF